MIGTQSQWCRSGKRYAHIDVLHTRRMGCARAMVAKPVCSAMCDQSEAPYLAPQLNWMRQKSVSSVSGAAEREEQEAMKV